MKTQKFKNSSLKEKKGVDYILNKMESEQYKILYMKKQSKKKSLFESITNTIIGLVTSFIIQIIIYPILEIQVSICQNITITFVFCITSILRGYVVRRMFNKI